MEAPLACHPEARPAPPPATSAQPASRRRLTRPATHTPAVTRSLRDRDMLPAIFFIFSRRECDSSAQAFESHDITLTTPEGAQCFSFTFFASCCLAFSAVLKSLLS